MLKQPVSIVHYTNVAIVRLKVNKDKFEVACFKNKIKQYREKIEKDINEVLQVSEIFTNSIKGEKANKKLLNKYFPNMSNEEIIDLILNKGDIQISEKERENDLANTKNDIASIVCEKTFDLNTGKPFAQNVIINTINELGINIKETEDPKKQALKIIKQLLESKSLNIDRRYMKLSLRIKINDEKTNKKPNNIMIDDDIFDENTIKFDKKNNKTNNKENKNKKNDKSNKKNKNENDSGNKKHKNSDFEEIKENKNNLNNTEDNKQETSNKAVPNKKKKKGKNKNKKYDSSSDSEEESNKYSGKKYSINESKNKKNEENSESENEKEKDNNDPIENEIEQDNDSDEVDIQNKINNYKINKENEYIIKKNKENLLKNNDNKLKDENSTKAINDGDVESEDIYIKEFSSLIRYLDSIQSKILNKNDFLLIKPVSILSNSDSKEINQEDINKINHNVKVNQMSEDVMKMCLLCLVSPNYYREMASKFDSSKLI